MTRASGWRHTAKLLTAWIILFDAESGSGPAPSGGETTTDGQGGGYAPDAAPARTWRWFALGRWRYRGAAQTVRTYAPARLTGHAIVTGRLQGASTRRCSYVRVARTLTAQGATGGSVRGETQRTAKVVGMTRSVRAGGAVPLATLAGRTTWRVEKPGADEALLLQFAAALGGL